MKQKILICGATGFIGRNLTEFFAQNNCYEVYATYFSRSPYECENVTFIKTDLRVKEDVEKAIQGMDIVIQSAATTSGSKDIVQTPYIHVTDNVVMSSLIFRACHDFNVKKVVFFSCTVMYQSSEKPLSELDFDANETIYPNYFGVGWTKVYLEKQAEFFSRLGKTEYSVLRHTNVYGPHDKYDLEKSHVFGATVTKVIKNTSGTIEVWGSGNTGRDMLYVEDLLDAVNKSIQNQNKPFGLYNIGTGKAVMIKNLVQQVIKASGKDINIVFDKTKPDIKTMLCVDYSRATNELGWTPQTSLKDGIQKTINWYMENIK